MKKLSLLEVQELPKVSLDYDNNLIKRRAIIHTIFMQAYYRAVFYSSRHGNADFSFFNSAVKSMNEFLSDTSNEFSLSDEYGKLPLHNINESARALLKAVLSCGEFYLEKFGRCNSFSTICTTLSDNFSIRNNVSWMCNYSTVNIDNRIYHK